MRMYLPPSQHLICQTLRWFRRTSLKVRCKNWWTLSASHNPCTWRIYSLVPRQIVLKAPHRYNKKYTAMVTKLWRSGGGVGEDIISDLLLCLPSLEMSPIMGGQNLPPRLVFCSCALKAPAHTNGKHSLDQCVGAWNPLCGDAGY